MRRTVLWLLILSAPATACGQRLPSVAEPPEAGRPAIAAAPAPPLPGDRLDAYRGLGAWIDIYDERLWADPSGTADGLAGQGVRTLFLQITTHGAPGPVRYPAAAGRLLEAAHANGLRVVAWYVPGFERPRKDLRAALAATAFRSPGGDAFDGLALDIEVTAVRDPVERARRLVLLSRALRSRVGPAYPLGAIIPSPLRSPGYWPVLPTAELARIYDVLLPMAYWTGHAEGEAGAYDYIARSVEITRAEAGPDVPIHVIGGVAHPAETEEVRGFVRAVSDARLVGASIYDVATTSPDEWNLLHALRA